MTTITDNKFPRAGAGCDEQTIPALDAPPPSRLGQLAGLHENLPCQDHASLQGNAGAPPYSEVCDGCEEAKPPCPVCPRRHAIQGNLERAHRNGRCPDSVPACGYSIHEPRPPRELCQACIGEVE